MNIEEKKENNSVKFQSARGLSVIDDFQKIKKKNEINGNEYLFKKMNKWINKVFDPIENS